MEHNKMPQHDCAVHCFTCDEFINKDLKETITISLEEYKELLMIKGKYEESKKQNIINIPSVWQDGIKYEYPYKVTCAISEIEMEEK